MWSWIPEAKLLEFTAVHPLVFWGDGLCIVPMLDNLAVLNAEQIDLRMAGLPW